MRKDVQKASYYVWFLGAEEARALRGSRTLLTAIPYVVDRSQEIEPIKVTLQVSHKGMKIVQVNNNLIILNRTERSSFHNLHFSFITLLSLARIYEIENQKFSSVSYSLFISFCYFIVNDFRVHQSILLHIVQ